MYLGIDSSTQSLSGMVLDPASGRIVCEASVNFGADLPQYGAPSGFIPGGASGEVHADPLMWLEALDEMLSRLGKQVDLSAIKAIGGSGQQHGSVYLNASFIPRLVSLRAESDLRSQLQDGFSRATSPIWMDTSTSAQCAEMAAAVGGNAEVCRLTGSIAIERFTGSQIRKFYQIDAAFRYTDEEFLTAIRDYSPLASKRESMYPRSVGITPKLHQLACSANPQLADVARLILAGSDLVKSALIGTELQNELVTTLPESDVQARFGSSKSEYLKSIQEDVTELNNLKQIHDSLYTPENAAALLRFQELRREVGERDALRSIQHAQTHGSRAE
jgi:hypothetical protein